MGPVKREFFEGEPMRAALGARDIGTAYRLLRRVGLSQRTIAHFTGQSQSEVGEILRGRRVSNVWVLERVADGLGVPRAWMGLSYGEQEPDSSPVPEEVDQKVKRHALIAAALGQTVLGLGGEPMQLALPTEEEPLPSQLTIAHTTPYEGSLRGYTMWGDITADRPACSATR